MSKQWPDSNSFWRDKRVAVTGGAGFLGSFVVEKLHARGAAEVFVPRIEDYDPSTVLRAGLVELSARIAESSARRNENPVGKGQLTL